MDPQGQIQGLPEGAVVGPPLPAAAAATAASPSQAGPQPTATAPQIQGLPQGAVVGPPLGQEEQKPDFTATGVATGAGKEALDQAKGMLTTVFPGQQSLMADIHALPAVYKAYEMARQQGKGVLEAASMANDEAKKQQDAQNVIKQRIAQFTTNPDEATGRTLMDAITILMGAKGMVRGALGGEAGAAEGAESGAEGAGKPGLIKQIVKGKEVSQPAAQETLRSVGNPEEPSLREVLSKPIEEAETKKSALYKAYDDAAGVDRKALQERLDNTQDQMSKLTGTPGDMKRLARLKEAETSLKSAISDADKKAADAGVKIEDADAANVKVRALREVEEKVFHNQEVVKGNIAQGGEETVNVENAIKAIQKLKDQEKFGGPRWDQAFGDGSADEVLSKLRQAHAQGVSALKKQQFAKIVGGTLGVGAVAKMIGAGAEALNQ